MSWHPVVLSVQVTVVASLLIVVAGLPLALFLARARFPGQTILESVIDRPLVLPPSVIGYYLPLALGAGVRSSKGLGPRCYSPGTQRRLRQQWLDCR